MTASVPGQAYDSSMGGTIAPGSVAVTEDKTTTGGSVGGCGEASLLAVVAPQLPGTSTSPSALGALIQWADNHGLTLAANGDSSPSNLIGIAKNYFNVTINSFGALPQNLVGKKQIEVGISRAYELGGWNSNVQGHYITIVGQTADGNYVVSDPNQPESENGQFIVYTPQQIQRAAPFWYGAASQAPSGLAGVTASGQGLTTSSAGAGSGGFDWSSFWQGVGQNIPFVSGAAGNANNWLGAVEAIVGTVGGWVGNPIRMLKLVAGVGLIGFALLALVLPQALTATGAVTGQPELVMAGSAVGAMRGQNQPAQRAAMSVAQANKRAANPPPARQPLPVQVVRPPKPPPPPPPPPRQAPTTVPLRQAPVTQPVARTPQGPGNRASLAPTIGPQNPPLPRVTVPLASSTGAPAPMQRGPQTGLTPLPPQRAPTTAPLKPRRPPVPPRRAPITAPLPPDRPYWSVIDQTLAGLRTPGPPLRQAPTTQPLSGPKTVQSGMPMTQAEASGGLRSLLSTWRKLLSGQSASGKP